jgi:hypothetical protein
MSIHPETEKVVVADPWDSAGKAEERQALSEPVLGHRGRGFRHVRKSTFMNLGDPCVCPHDVDSGAAQAARLERREVRPRHSSDEPGNDRGAKGVAERGSGK